MKKLYHSPGSKAIKSYFDRRSIQQRLPLITCYKIKLIRYSKIKKFGVILSPTLQTGVPIKKAGIVSSLPFPGEVVMGLGGPEKSSSSVPSSNNQITIHYNTSCRNPPNPKPLIFALPVFGTAPFQFSVQILIDLLRSIDWVNQNRNSPYCSPPSLAVSVS